MRVREGVGHFALPGVTRSAQPSPDQALAGLAEAQELVFHLDQLRAIGFTAAGVRKRLACSRLFRVHVGVYSLVPPSKLSLDGRRLAAVLACGPAAVLGFRDAASLHELRRDGRSRIDVIVPGRTTRRHPGIDVHRTVTLNSQDVTVVRNIPVTTVARTIVDLAEVVPQSETDRALEQAEVLGVFDLVALHDQIDRNPGRTGAARVARSLEGWQLDLGAVWSVFEATLLDAVQTAGAPPPVRNGWIVLDDGGPAIRPDLHWPAQRVVAQADGWRFHRARAAFERGARDDQRLLAAGWLPVRLTWWQLRDERERLVGTIVALVRQRTPTGTLSR